MKLEQYLNVFLNVHKIERVLFFLFLNMYSILYPTVQLFITIKNKAVTHTHIFQYNVFYVNLNC
jgi:hypothetical protein